MYEIHDGWLTVKHEVEHSIRATTVSVLLEDVVQVEVRRWWGRIGEPDDDNQFDVGVTVARSRESDGTSITVASFINDEASADQLHRDLLAQVIAWREVRAQRIREAAHA